MGVNKYQDYKVALKACRRMALGATIPGYTEQDIVQAMMLDWVERRAGNGGWQPRRAFVDIWRKVRGRGEARRHAVHVEYLDQGVSLDGCIEESCDRRRVLSDYLSTCTDKQRQRLSLLPWGNYESHSQAMSIYAVRRELKEREAAL